MVWGVWLLAGCPPSYPHNWISLTLIPHSYFIIHPIVKVLYIPAPHNFLHNYFIPLHIFKWNWPKYHCALSLFRAVSAMVTIVKFNLVLNIHCLVISYFHVEMYLLLLSLNMILLWLWSKLVQFCHICRCSVKFPTHWSTYATVVLPWAYINKS